MLVLEALGALWFWASFSSVLSLPASSDSVLPAVAVAERAWFTREEAWFDPLAAELWKRRWLEKTGCCVDFVSDAQNSKCLGQVRVVHAKSVQSPEGWRMGFVAVACG